MEKMKRQLIGMVGTIVTALCCLGTPALLAFLAAIGAGFVINDLILMPLLVVFLGIGLWGMRRALAVHGQSWPLILAVVSSVVTFSAVWFSRPLVLLGLLGFVATSVWDMALHKRCTSQARHTFKAESSSS
jgi:mercuric ion transport protein